MKKENNSTDQAITRAIHTKGKKQNRIALFFAKLFEKNSFLKVIAIVIALVLWLYVSMFINTQIPRDITGVLVEIDPNATALQNFNLIPIDFGTPTINVNIYGDRSDVSNLKREDFTALVDLSSVTGAGKYDLSIDVAAIEQSLNMEITSIKPETITVEFDSKMDKTLEVTPSEEFDTITVSDEYIKGEYQVSPQEIKVSGPSKEIEKIASVDVDITSDLPTNIVDSYTIMGDIVLRDALGNELDSDLIVKTKEATVTIPVQKIKTVELAVEFTDLPYYIIPDTIKYELSQKEIRVVGEKNDIEKLPDTVTIDFMSLNKLDLDTVKEIPLELPSGIIDYDKVTSVTMKLNMPNFIKQTFTSDQIKIVNIPSGYAVTSDISMLSDIQIIGEEYVLENLSGSDIIVEVNMFDKEIHPGKSYKRATILIPNALGLVWAVDPTNPSSPIDEHYKIPVEITKIDDAAK